MMETTETKIDSKVFSVAILTPYLTENLVGASDIEKQIEKYGYNPRNLSGVKTFGTEKGNRVLIRSPEYMDGSCRRDSVNPKRFRDLTLVIAGSTEPGEQEVRNMKCSGLIVARYSIFYGKNSNYTGNSPQAGGYSLDIPKNVKSVMSLLSSDETLEALAERDEFRIRGALGELNLRLEQPILATTYLSKALTY